jgi:hypothetical protein
VESNDAAAAPAHAEKGVHPSRPRRHARLAANALLSSFSCGFLALGLVALESVARWWDPQYLTRVRGLFVYNPVYGWSGRPHAVGRMGTGRITLDARGFRGRTLEVPRTELATRVVVVGDSIASGYGVSDEEPFPRLLDLRDNGIEAGNLAVEGYGPGQELLVLEREALRLEPEIVVLAVCLRNDFVDSLLPVALYDGVTPRPVFGLEGERIVIDDAPVRKSAAARVAQWLADYSHLYNRASSVLLRPEASAERSWRLRKREALHDEESVFRLTMSLIREAQRISRQHGVRLLVATFPNGVSYDMRPGMQQRLHESLAAEGIWFVDMRAEFSKRGWQARELALDDVGHLTPLGHLVSADVLEGEIVRRRRAAERP